ncbi:MAG: hypothetical protein ACOCQD_05490 [archaeon]
MSKMAVYLNDKQIGNLQVDFIGYWREVGEYAEENDIQNTQKISEINYRGNLADLMVTDNDNLIIELSGYNVDDNDNLLELIEIH